MTRMVRDEEQQSTVSHLMHDRGGALRGGFHDSHAVRIVLAGVEVQRSACKNLCELLG